MKKRTAFVGAILSLIPFGQPLLIKTGVVVSSSTLMLSLPEKVNAETFEFYYERAYKKGEKGDHNGSISDFTKAIEIYPTFAEAYYNRGVIKLKLKDHNGSISDFTKAIEINPTYEEAYYNRGTVKALYLSDEYGAISDFTKAIEINPNDTAYYLNRSIAKEGIGDIKGACEDAKKAVSLGNTASDIKSWIRDNC